MDKDMYIGVNSIARRIKDMYIGVNGVACKVINGYIGVNGIARQFYSASIPIGNLPIGALIKFRVSGTYQLFRVVHKNRPDATLYDSTWDNSITVMAVNLIAVMRQSPPNFMANFASSEVLTYLDSTYYPNIEISARNQIKQVRIPYVSSAYPDGAGISSGANGLLRTIFIPASREMAYGESTGDGQPFSYFLPLSTTDTRRIATYNGIASAYWMRTIYTSTNYTSAYLIGIDGSGNLMNPVANSFGIRPTMVFPNTLLLNPTPDTDGAYVVLV